MGSNYYKTPKNALVQLSSRTKVPILFIRKGPRETMYLDLGLRSIIHLPNKEQPAQWTNRLCARAIGPPASVHEMRWQMTWRSPLSFLLKKAPFYLIPIGSGCEPVQVTFHVHMHVPVGHKNAGGSVSQ
jgi:hypothetical protein